MKKHLIILVTVIFAIVFICVIFSREAFITQKEENVNKIIIVMKKNEYCIEDKKEINRIFELVKQTYDFFVEKYPSHAESVQWDPPATISFIYENGETDEFFLSENEEHLLKFLKKQANSSDLGFKGGKNEKLVEYLYDHYGTD